MPIKQPLTTLLLFLFPLSCFAINHSSYAYVEIVENLEMIEAQALNFGLIENIDGICVMASDGTLSGQNGQNCSGTSSPGEFTISGTSDQNIIVTVMASNAQDGVAFTPEIDGANSRTLEGGSATVTVIGQLTLSDALIGGKSIEYTITANYQ